MGSSKGPACTTNRYAVSLMAAKSNLLGMPFEESFDLFVRAITPVGGDPTYTVLKSHLLIEDMLVEYIHRKLPNPKAMRGARLSFFDGLPPPADRRRPTSAMGRGATSTSVRTVGQKRTHRSH